MLVLNFGKLSRRRISALAAAVAAVSFAPRARAATSTWNGNGNSVNWSVTGNWTGGAPSSSSSTNLIFAGTNNDGTAATPLNQNITSGFNFSNITFNSGGGSFFLGGSSFNVDNNESITQSSSALEFISNNFSVSTNSTQILTLGGTGTGFVTLSGTINKGTGNRNIAISVTSGDFLLSNTTSNFSGGTSITGGLLEIAGAGSLGGGNVTVGTSGELALNASFDISGVLVSSSTGIVALNANNSALTGFGGSSVFLGSV